MSDLDRKLFACRREGPYLEAEWREIIHHVISKLETFLGQPVATSDVEIYSDGFGFSGDISSPEHFAALLQISWFGRIGVNDNPDLSAWLFFRGFGRRLIAQGGSGDFLWLHYTEQAPGQFGWSMCWDKDEFGEFEHWDGSDWKSPGGPPG